MGLFGLFGGTQKAKQKKAEKYFHDCEKICKEYLTAGLMGDALCGAVLGVYLQHWKWEEFYGLTRVDERRKQAEAELKNMLTSRDKKTKRAARSVIDESREKKRQEMEALMAYQREIARYAQDELGMELFDQDGNKLKMHKDGTVARQKD